MNKEEILKRKEEWIEKLKREGKIGDPKEDHKRSLDALQSPTRRETIKFIGIGNKKSLEEIKEEFKLDSNQAKFNLGTLERALFIEKVEGDEAVYVLTPRGEAYVEGIEWGDEAF